MMGVCDATFDTDNTGTPFALGNRESWGTSHGWAGTGMIIRLGILKELVKS